MNPAGKIVSCFLFLVSYYSLLSAQTYPQDYFRNPLNIPIQLAANFGELRENHFHMGLDIRTESRENLPVYAAADGYVSEIKIEKYGFGKAIYISHSNGYTTLYGHLNKFFPALDDYVKSKEYKDESWEQDIIFQPGSFPVVKGQFIAYSGNTGASAGPHLHFEIRDSKTGNNLNPELFGFNIEDKIPPVIHALYWYDRRYSTYQSSPVPIPFHIKNGAYSSVNKIVRVSSPLISLGISAEDKNSGSSFLFGIYSAELWLDDSLINTFTLNDFSYDETRYVNACIDYKTFILSKKYIQHLCVLPGNYSSIFHIKNSNGIIILADTIPHLLAVYVKDVYGNSSKINFAVQFSGMPGKKNTYPLNAKPMLPDRENFISTDNVKVQFSGKAFYDAVPFVLNELPGNAANAASYLFALHNYTVPVHGRYNILIKTFLKPGDTLRNKVVARLLSGAYKDITKGEWQGDWMKTSFNRLGNVQLWIDTVPPLIQPDGWKDGAKIPAAQTSLRVKCTDDLGELQTFRATLDSNWLMFSKKGDDCIYYFDEHCSKGRHGLSVTIADVAGNIKQKNFSFEKQ